MLSTVMGIVLAMGMPRLVKSTGTSVCVCAPQEPHRTLAWPLWGFSADHKCIIVFHACVSQNRYNGSTTLGNVELVRGGKFPALRKLGLPLFLLEEKVAA
jgi:hypothetical protein